MNNAQYTNAKITTINSGRAMVFSMNDAGYAGDKCLYKVTVFRDGTHDLLLTGKNGETLFNQPNDTIKNNIIKSVKAMLGVK